jgi:biopolymer transport protein ExbD
MTLKGAKQVHYDSGPNMTPLVDVVMVILIFLMLAGSFGTSEHFMVASLPQRPTGVSQAPPDPTWIPPIEVQVQVSPDGDASVLGSFSHEPDPEKVRTALAAKVAQLKAANAHDPKRLEKIEAILRPAPGTRWDRLAPLYDAALRADFAKVSFAQAQ